MMPVYFERPGPPPGVDLVTQAELDAAVAGTVPVYNVTAYGATGDGTTDDTAAIQDALDAVPVGGGIVPFPARIYLVPSGGLTCDAPVTISGAGFGDYEDGGTRLRCTSSTATLLTLSSPGSTVQVVCFENTSGTRPTAGAGLLCTDFDWGRVDRCGFIGFWNGLQVDAGYFYTVRDSTFLAPRNYGAYLRNTASGQTDHGDWAVIGCNFSKYGDSTTGGTAIRWESGGGIRLVGNKINSGTQPGYPSTGYWQRGIDIALTSGSTSVCVVVGNSVEGMSTGDGIRVAGAAGTFHSITITGNEILQLDGTGTYACIRLDGSAMTSLSRASITANSCTGGVPVVLNSVSDVAVVGNVGLADGGYWLNLTKVKGLILSGNRATGSAIDNDSGTWSATAGHARGLWKYGAEITGLTTNATYGAVWPAMYSTGVVTVRVFGDVQTVGAVRLQQSRQLTKGNGAASAVTVGSTIGTDLALGAASAELTLSYDVATTSGACLPKVTSVNGKNFRGAIEVEYDGLIYVVTYPA